MKEKNLTVTVHTYLRNTIIGISSFGMGIESPIPCQTSEYAGAYAKVTYALPWIKNVLAFTQNITGGVEAIAHDSKCNEINL